MLTNQCSVQYLNRNGYFVFAQSEDCHLWNHVYWTAHTMYRLHLVCKELCMKWNRSNNIKCSTSVAGQDWAQQENASLKSNKPIVQTLMALAWTLQLLTAFSLKSCNLYEWNVFPTSRCMKLCINDDDDKIFWSAVCGEGRFIFTINRNVTHTNLGLLNVPSNFFSWT